MRRAKLLGRGSRRALLGAVQTADSTQEISLQGGSQTADPAAEMQRARAKTGSPTTTLPSNHKRPDHDPPLKSQAADHHPPPQITGSRTTTLPSNHRQLTTLPLKSQAARPPPSPSNHRQPDHHPPPQITGSPTVEGAPWKERGRSGRWRQVPPPRGNKGGPLRSTRGQR